MRLNENTKIVGKLVTLIPYNKKHVHKYHNWMKSRELQELTASEPLTLAEEFENQVSWRESDNKCTFLILSRETYERSNDEMLALIGDTNLFLRREDSDGTVANVAEAEIMIAEIWARGRGYGWESMLLLLKYAQVNMDIAKFEAKIGMDNVRSIRMFEKMKFTEVSRAEIFREVTLECNVSPSWIAFLNSQIKFHCEPYDEKIPVSDEN